MAQPRSRPTGQQTTEDAILAAVKRGEKLAKATDQAGQEFTQRPFSLSTAEPPAPEPDPDEETVLVYHLRNARCQLPGGVMLQPHSKARIPVSVAMAPWLREHVMILDERHESEN